MTGWDKLIGDYLEHGIIGVCPECGKPTISILKHESDIRDSYTLRCSNCERCQHYDCCTKQKQD